MRSNRAPSHRGVSENLRIAALGVFLATLLMSLDAVAAVAPTPPTGAPKESEVEAPKTPEGIMDAGERGFSATGVRKYRKRQPRPIKLGVSGGNTTDIFIEGAFSYCSSGTLGALVLKNGIPHILSNNHVLAKQNEGRKGDPVDQPGLIDNRCRDEVGNYVAHLSAYKKLKFGGSRNNRVDAAIAEIIGGTVDPQGRIQGIGIPGDSVMQPFLGMQVQKAGRTSGLTKGTVILLDATFAVDFGTEEEPRSAKFVHQLMVSPNKRTFVEPGDSGSAVFFDRDDCPEWVGLLFAGSADGWGIVNPISRVFKALKKLKPRGRVSPVGCSSAPSTGSLDAISLRSARADDVETERQLRNGRRIVERRDDELLALAGVVGLGLGLEEPRGGQLALHILVTDSRPEIVERIPAVIDGMPTKILETGRFRAFQEVPSR